MKVTIEFDFDDPEKDDRAEHMRMMKATDLCSVIFDMQCYFRGKLENTEKFESGEKELEDASEKLFELMDRKGIMLDELYT